MAPHSSILAWKILWMEEPGRLRSMGSLGVRHDWATSLSCIGEGNGNPLQCSCLENPRDRGAWWAAVYGVTQSRPWLKPLSSSSRDGNGMLMKENVFILRSVLKSLGEESHDVKWVRGKKLQRERVNQNKKIQHPSVWFEYACYLEPKYEDKHIKWNLWTFLKNCFIYIYIMYIYIHIHIQYTYIALYALYTSLKYNM